jgi:hypothetical protein
VLLLHDELHLARRADFGMGFHFNNSPQLFAPESHTWSITTKFSPDILKTPGRA